MVRGKQLRTPLLVVILVVAATVGLYAVTRDQVTGLPPARRPMTAEAAQEQISIDTILFHAKEELPSGQLNKLSQLELLVRASGSSEERLHGFHQLARYWGDSLRMFAPYAWYTAEAARLENSEKSLTFAAHLFLNSLTADVGGAIKQWGAFQAKDLFERSLKLNPANDSSKIGLGAVYLYGGIDMPMTGINMIREVANKDSNNVYAQMTLGEASLVSGQLDKGLERFKKVAAMQPDNVDALLRAGDVAEKLNLKKEAVEWYRRSLPFITNSSLKYEVQTRISGLEKQIN